MKNLLDLSRKEERLLDTIHPWVAWNKYRWKRGTGDWYECCRWPAKPVNVVANSATKSY